MDMLSQHWFQVQKKLFPYLEEEEGHLGDNHERLVTVVEISNVIKIVNQIYHIPTWGRPSLNRANIAIAFLAKHVFNLPTTVALIDRLHYDRVLRRICGFERKRDIPSEATFSRVFHEFSEMKVTEILLDVLITKHHGNRIIGHVSRDSTEISAREKAEKKPKEKKNKTPKRPRGRPKKGSEHVEKKEEKRLEKQKHQTLEEMEADLPRACDYGSKRDSQGFQYTWKGYKYHIDTIDGDIPVSVILTSASVHDSQVALPLRKLTMRKINFCYELMDSAYDAKIIREEIRSSGHVGLIDYNRRGPKDERKFEDFEAERYKQRSSVERVNGNLKDNLGASTIRVRGHKKIFTHLGFGILIIAVEQTLKLLC